jgi:hypothetical protein
MATRKTDESKKILIVDDRYENFATGKLLEKQGHIVSYAMDYISAIKHLEFKRIGEPSDGKFNGIADMLLTDLEIPWGDDPDRPHRDDGLPHALGYGLVLAAIANKIPYVGMITNQNHHNSPLAATWDYLPYNGIIECGATTLGIWDERTCVARKKHNWDLFYQNSAKELITVPDGEHLRYKEDPNWKEVRPPKHWHYAAWILLNYEALKSGAKHEKLERGYYEKD